MADAHGRDAQASKDNPDAEATENALDNLGLGSAGRPARVDVNAQARDEDEDQVWRRSGGEAAGVNPDPNARS